MCGVSSKKILHRQNSFSYRVDHQKKSCKNTIFVMFHPRKKICKWKKDRSKKLCIGYCQKSLMYSFDKLARLPPDFSRVPQFENFQGFYVGKSKLTQYLQTFEIGVL